MLKRIVILLLSLTSLYSKGIIDSRIIGGNELHSIVGREFAVSLQHLQYGQYNAFCGGALIDSTHVITAAHCITDDDIYVFAKHSVTPGQQQIAQLQGGGPIKGEIKIVTRVFKNRDFATKSIFGGDIAVLEIGEPITISKYLQLPTLGLTNPLLAKNESMELLGWGLESHTAKMPSGKLRTVTLKTLTPIECKNEFLAPPADGARGVDPSSKDVDEFAASGMENFDELICAGGAKVGQTDKGACIGDSGGPLVYHSGDTSILIGVVSGGRSSACTGKISGNYAKVEKYLKFIEDAKKGAYESDGVLRLGDVQAMPIGFSLSGSPRRITSKSKIMSKDVKTIYVYYSITRKWKIFNITNGVLPDDFVIPAKHGFWLYK